MVAVARQVRQRSSCTTLLVTSDDPHFLAAFAHQSRVGRLLVWSTRLLLVTRLPSSDAHLLLKRHWSYAMMNTMLLNLPPDSWPYPQCEVSSHLPHGPAGPGIIRLATWTPQDGLITRYPLFPPKYSNFHGATFPVTALILPPLWRIVEDKMANGTVVTRFSGREHFMLQTVASKLNFTVHHYRCYALGEILENIENGKVLLNALRMVLMPQVLARVDYTYMIEPASYTFCLAKPTITPQWQNLYYPLDDQVWLTLMAFLLLVPGLMYLVLYAGGDAQARRELQTHSVALEALGMLLDQDLWIRLPRADSGRVLVVSWLMLGFIMGMAYRGNLIAFLTVPKYPHRPETIEDLASTGLSSRYTQNESSFFDYFRQSQLTSFTSVAKRGSPVATVLEGLRAARHDGVAYFHERHNMELMIAQHHTMADGSSPIYVARHNVLPNFSAWMLPFDAPFKADFDRCLARIMEAGLKDKWTIEAKRESYLEIRLRRRNSLEEEEEESHVRESSSGLQPLTLTHLQGPAWLLLFGLLASGITFLVEIMLLLHHHHPRLTHRTPNTHNSRLFHQSPHPHQ
ncbi:ionotropic receptor 93a-like isoform X2 [Panulirus ornatus]